MALKKSSEQVQTNNDPTARLTFRGPTVNQVDLLLTAFKKLTEICYDGNYRQMITEDEALQQDYHPESVIPAVQSQVQQAQLGNSRLKYYRVIKCPNLTYQNYDLHQTYDYRIPLNKPGFIIKDKKDEVKPKIPQELIPKLVYINALLHNIGQLAVVELKMLNLSEDKMPNNKIFEHSPTNNTQTNKNKSDLILRRIVYRPGYPEPHELQEVRNHLPAQSLAILALKGLTAVRLINEFSTATDEHIAYQADSTGHYPGYIFPAINQANQTSPSSEIRPVTQPEAEGYQNESYCLTLITNHPGHLLVQQPQLTEPKFDVD